MNIKFLSSGEKKKLFQELDGLFGIGKLDYIFIETGKEKIRAFSGDLTKDEIILLNDAVRIELVGMYFARKEPFSLRLGFDATQLLSDKIKEGFIELNEDDFKLWMGGNVLKMDADDGLYAVKYGNDFLGCGYVKDEKMYNYVPKERQLRGFR